MLTIIKFTELITSLANDLEIDSHTVDYCVRRLRAEGPSFLLVTLPTFSKHVVRCVELGYYNNPDVPDSLWSSFYVRQWDSISPIFGVQLKRLFSRRGILKKDPSAQALLAIRQFCEYLYKLALSFTKEQTDKALEKYKSNELLVGDGVKDDYLEKLRRFILRNYFKSLKSYDQILRCSRPRDTTGAYAQSRYHAKWYGMSVSEYRQCLVGARTLPDVRHAVAGFLKPSNTSVSRGWLRASPLRRDANKRCEVLFVPKDSRGPRVISKEPMGSLRFQMSFFDYMVDLLPKVTEGRILFDDQTVHRNLAHIGSTDGSWATMDLKDASDMVPTKVAHAIYRHTPLELFLHFRSQKALLPDGESVVLRKLSGMGSGLTFPTMALIIHSTVSYEIARYAGIPERKAMRLCYVYGDDLVVPSKYAFLVKGALAKAGLRLNEDKCFIRGPFRESCGADFLNGEDVTPVRLRLASLGLPDKRAVSHFGGIPVFHKGDPTAIVQIVRHANELQKNGLVNTAEFFYSLAESGWLLDACLPTVKYESSVLGRLADSDFDVLSCPESVKDPVFVPVTYATDSFLYAIARKRGVRAHDFHRTYVEKLKSLDDPDEYVPFTGISHRKNGKIHFRPGSYVRRFANDESYPITNFKGSLRKEWTDIVLWRDPSLSFNKGGAIDV